jgi:arsenite methyltransferase
MTETTTANTATAGGNVEGEVLRRYRASAKQAEKGFCCPIEYEKASLDILPREIVEKDYGCGDPSKYVRPGETVIDLGSGAGKICYILAHKVGADGQVIGVDFNDDMLALSRKYLDEMAHKLGYRNVRFVKGMIQDLALDLDKAQAWLDKHPIRTVEGLYDYQAECDRLRRDEPLIHDGTVDVVVSNCVLNLARPEDKGKLFAEMHRVLRKGGRAVISDIVCDEDPTPQIKADADLWSGCIAGAMREDEFLEMFVRAGFYGIEILVRQAEPWQTIDGIEFRSVTVQAFKGKEGPCIERNQAVIYQGPWKCVCDDDGHTLLRGQRMAVCDKTFGIMTNPDGPYAGQVVPVPPREDVPLAEAKPFDCTRSDTRHPRETKGMEYRPTKTTQSGPCCGSNGCDTEQRGHD